MGMFRAPYGKGGVLSKEAVEARKKLYKDLRPKEEQRKENRILLALYLLQLPFLLIPGFFPKAALSHQLYLSLLYGICIIQLVLTAVRLFSYFGNKGSVDGWNYQKSFIPLEGNIALASIFGGILLLAQGYTLLFHRRDGGLLEEVAVFLLLIGFLVFSLLLWRRLRMSLSAWKMEEQKPYDEELQ